MGELARATLQALDINGGTLGKAIQVCFNPKEYSLEKKVTWNKSKTQGDASLMEFGEPAPMTLSVTLQFDTYEERVSVRDKWVRQIEGLTLVQPHSDSGAGGTARVTPPMVLFTWGKFRFKGVIDSLSQKYTMFLSDGTPVRADCTISIQNALDSKELANNAPDQSQQETTVALGDPPGKVAQGVYGDPTAWKDLFEANEVDDPLNFSGTVVKKGT